MIKKIQQTQWTKIVIIILLLILITIPTRFTIASAKLSTQNTPTVHVVLLYSPTCPHCQKVIIEVLPPLVDKYGSHTRLSSFIGTEGSQFQAQEGLQGKNTPLVSVTPTTDDKNNTTNGPSQGSIVLQKFRRDLVGNSLAVIVLLGMVVSVFFIIYRFFTTSDSQGKGTIPSWVIPILCLIGLGVAGYLTYVETSHVKAVCGPVGDCNSVQQSSYATLWGIMPVGVFGILGYLGIGLAWVVYQFNPAQLKSIGALAMWGMAFLGTLFSIYLTFLEPFVIGATCIWCITSAIVITLLLWITTNPALQASTRMMEEDEYE